MDVEVTIKLCDVRKMKTDDKKNDVKEKRGREGGAETE